MKLAFTAIGAALIFASQASAMGGLENGVTQRDAALGAVYSTNMGEETRVDADTVYTGDTLALNPVATVNQYDFSDDREAKLETGLGLGKNIR